MKVCQIVKKGKEFFVHSVFEKDHVPESVSPVYNIDVTNADPLPKENQKVLGFNTKTKTYDSFETVDLLRYYYLDFDSRQFISMLLLLGASKQEVVSIMTSINPDIMLVVEGFKNGYTYSRDDPLMADALNALVTEEIFTEQEVQALKDAWPVGTRRV